ncbi:hypothetical protein D9M71_710010 [compost metagenome]
MACEPISKAHTSQRTIQSILADALAQIASMSEQVSLCRYHLIQQQPYDFGRLDRQRNNVWRHLCGLTARFAHLEL